MATQEIYAKGNSNDPGSVRWLYDDGEVSFRAQANIDGRWVDIDEAGSAGGLTYTPPGGVERTVAGKLGEIVSVGDYQADPTGATDNTEKLQDALNDASARNSGRGGKVVFPEGVYLTGPLVWPANVQIEGAWPGGIPSRKENMPTLLKAAPGSTGFLLQTPDDGSTLKHANSIVGVGFQGLGAGTALGGISIRRTLRANIIGCAFDNFADQAILTDATANTVTSVRDVLAQNCLLNRTRGTIAGVLEMLGADFSVAHCEITTSVSTDGSLSTAAVTGTAQAGASTTITLASGASAVDDYYNGWIVELTGGTGSGGAALITDYVGSTKVATVQAAWSVNPASDTTYRLTSVQCVGLLARGASGSVHDSIFEICDVGVVVLNGVAPTRITSVRADLCSAWGWIVGGYVAGGSGCMASRCSQAGDNSYDGVLVISGADGALSGFDSGCLATDTYAGNNYQQRYGFKIADGAGNSQKLAITGTGRNNQSALVSQYQTIVGSGFEVLGNGVKSFTSGATCFMDGFLNGRFQYGSSVTVTQFTGLVYGNIYTFTANNGNVTIQNNGSIVTKSGADVVMSSTKIFRFYATSSGACIEV